MALMHPLQKLVEFDPAAQQREARMRQLYPELYMESSDEEDGFATFQWDSVNSPAREDKGEGRQAGG
jgi:hypothetical protein